MATRQDESRAAGHQSVRGMIYDIVGLGFMISSGYFFYRCVDFLSQKDYVAGLIALMVGFVVVRIGVEVSKLGIFIGRERS
ncbi:MAG: hypothetical protein H0U74_16330 [Bradymonadaceae bacterium]|nr:hypothetical protein [Lujinxingiaceae bacterium]